MILADGSLAGDLLVGQLTDIQFLTYSESSPLFHIHLERFGCHSRTNQISVVPIFSILVFCRFCDGAGVVGML